MRRFRAVGMIGFEAEQVAAAADYDVRVERQLAEQRGAEFCAGARFADDESAGGADVHDVEFAELLGEQRGAESSVTAHVNAAKEDDESHGGIMRTTVRGIETRLCFVLECEKLSARVSERLRKQGRE